jgi:hypothetical protein
MKVPYKSRNPNAGIINYEIVDDAIVLEFADRRVRYIYNSTKPGMAHVNEMKRLALSGKGLTTYVNQHVRKNYVAQIPMGNVHNDLDQAVGHPPQSAALKQGGPL